MVLMKKKAIILCVSVLAVLLLFTACDITLTETNSQQHNHIFGEWIAEIPATCTNSGIRGHYHCSECNKDFDGAGNNIADLTISASHSYGAWSKTKEETCTNSGERKRVCVNCQDIQTEIIPAKGHTDGEWIIDQVPTCTEQGMKHQECAVCKITLKEETITELGHDFSNGKQCSRCEQIDTSWVKISTESQLRSIADNMRGKYELVTDIDLSASTWSALGSEVLPFSGVLNGNGHKIIFSSFTSSLENGLFYRNEGTIQNLTVNAKGVDISNANYKGAYFAITNNGLIDSCRIEGNRKYNFKASKSVGAENSWPENIVISCNWLFGEFCYSNTANGIIQNCVVDGSVSIQKEEYSAHWGIAYGLFAFRALSGNESCTVNTELQFGEICAINRGTIQNSKVLCYCNFKETLKTQTHYEFRAYAFAYINSTVKLGAVCAVNESSAIINNVNAIAATETHNIVYTNEAHENILYQYVQNANFRGQIAENKGTIMNLR